MIGPADELVALIRKHPDHSQVTWKFNQGDWQSSSGKDFLELWEQPVAGTIYVDGVFVTEEVPE